MCCRNVDAMYIIISRSAAVRMIMYSVSFVSLSLYLCVVKFCKQNISKSNLWIFAKFTADYPENG